MVGSRKKAVSRPDGPKAGVQPTRELPVGSGAQPPAEIECVVLERGATSPHPTN